MTQNRTASPAQRKAEIVIALLFLATAAASITAAFALDPILSAPDYLAGIFPNRGSIHLSALLWSVNNIGIVFIAVYAFGLLRKLDPALAAGYLAARIVEGTVMMVGVVAALLLIPVSRDYIAAGSPQSSWFTSIGDVLLHARFLGLTRVSLPILGLAGLIFTWALFRFRLVPRPIAVAGLVGYALALLAGIGGWFELVDVAPGGSEAFLAVPVALWEIVIFPFWLLVRGLRMPGPSAAVPAA